MTRFSLCVALAACFAFAAADVNVIVIGAGVSGLSAARHLLDNWPNDARGALNLKVVDVQKAIGGRTDTNSAALANFLAEAYSWDSKLPDWAHKLATVSKVGGKTKVEVKVTDGKLDGGALVDFGASWIHGDCKGSSDTDLSYPTCKHPISIIAHQLGLNKFTTQNDLLLVYECAAGSSPTCDSSSSAYDEKECASWQKEHPTCAEGKVVKEITADRFSSSKNGAGNYNEMISKAATVAKTSYDNGKGPDISVWKALSDIKETLNGQSVNDADDPLLQFHLGNTLEFEFGANPDKLSGRWYKDDEEIEGQESLILQGYSSVAAAFASGSLQLTVDPKTCADSSNILTADSIKATDSTGRAIGAMANTAITLSTQVKAISYDANAASNKVTVKTEQGDLQADQVVVTLPLGVLKKKSVSFSPDLSKAKTTAIDYHIGFGTVIKVALLFKDVFWNKNKHYFGAVLDAGLSNAEKYSYFLNAGAGAGDAPILFTFVFGDSALTAESLSWEEMQAGIVANMKVIWGSEVVGKNPIKAHWVSSWKTQEHFQGTYSYPTVPSEADAQTYGYTNSPVDFAALQAAEYGNTVHFAGEHTSHSYRGTVHGAFWSGQRAACEIFSETNPSGARRLAQNKTEDVFV